MQRDAEHEPERDPAQQFGGGDPHVAMLKLLA
jgi:hypothetical protein